MAERNYELCWYCQVDNGEPTTSTKLHMRFKNDEEGLKKSYENVVSQFKSLLKYDQLPEGSFIDSFAKDISVEDYGALLCKKNAVWHTLCRSKHDKQKVERAQKKYTKCETREAANPSSVKTRRSCTNKDVKESCNDSPSNDVNPDEEPCLICGEKGERRWGGCHKAATLGIHEKVWAAAKILQETILLAKLSAGDMVAIDAVYHLRCLVRLYKKADSVRDGLSNCNDRDKLLQQQVFVELQDYIESFRGTDQVIPMTEVCKMYHERMKDLGIFISVHTTRLRQKLLQSIPDLEAVKNKARHWDLLFNESLAAAVVELKRQESATDKVTILMKAASILRSAIFKSRENTKSPLKGNLGETPEEMKVFLSLLLNGSQVRQGQEIKGTVKVIGSLGQLISYNTSSKRQGNTDILRHSKKSETPFPLYLGIQTYLTTGKEIMDKHHHNGLMPSYDTIKRFATDIANTLIDKWRSDGVVLPPNAIKNVFICFGLDNIDWNAVNPLAQLLSTLHGTIFVVHFFPDRDEPYLMIEIAETQKGKKTVQELPESYTKIDYKYNLQTSDKYTIPPENQDPVVIRNLGLEHPLLDDCLLEPQKQWLNDCKVSLQKENLEKDEYITWGAYYASNSKAPEGPNMRSYPTPIHLEKASEPAMLAHLMMLAETMTEKLNPGQTPWIETDQPLYEKLKRLQQKYPEKFGENKFLITMGSLHTEKCLWSASGEFVNGSGYTSALTSSGVCTSGVAESIVSVSSILRTRYIKQVFVVAIEILKQRAYLDYLENAETETDINREGQKQDTGIHPVEFSEVTSTVEEDILVVGEDKEHILNEGDNTSKGVLSYDDWLNKKCKDQPQSDFWNKAQELDLYILQFVKTLRDGDFLCYRAVLDSLMKWIMALDRNNYKRDVPIMLRDLSLLEERHPALYVEFVENKRFVGQKTQNPFSRLPIDQCNEQIIDWLKNESAVIGNLDDPATVRRDQVARPELAQIVKALENGFDSTKQEDRKHHEQYPSMQKKFRKDVLALADAFVELGGNMFSEKSGHLYDLVNKVIMPAEVVECVRNIKSIGQLKYNKLLKERIIEKTCPISDTIPNTALKLFKYGLTKKNQISNPKTPEAAAKEQLQQIVDIVTAYQCKRTIAILSHESSEIPPTLTSKGIMHHGQKSDLLACIIPTEQSELPTQAENNQEEAQAPMILPNSSCTAAIFDGAVIVQFLRPTPDIKNIEMYINNIFMDYIVLFYHKGYNRLDLIYDCYEEFSNKGEMRESRGTGKAIKVELSTKRPGDWTAFLRVSANKIALFRLIAQYLLDHLEVPAGCVFVVTIGRKAVSKPATYDISDITPCTHEEADVRIFLHVAHAVSNGHTNIFIRTNDTDVVVLAVAALARLNEVLEDIVIGFGVSNKKTHKSMKYIEISEVMDFIGASRALALPGFHAFTGCDTVSSFWKRGKKLAWEVWNMYPAATQLFRALSSPVENIETLTPLQPILHAFVNKLFGLEGETVDEARFRGIVFNGKDFTTIPPSSDALNQKLLRTALQAGHMWGNMFIKQPAVPPLSDWGYVLQCQSVPRPLWITKPILSRKNCKQLSTCRCQTGECRPPCTCSRYKITCTPLCGCNAMCSHSQNVLSELSEDYKAICDKC